MVHYAAAFGLLLHVLFWGAGAAMLAMPRRWRAFWPVLIFPAGFALQSVVVWGGAWADLNGTNSYAWASEMVPLLLLIAALWNRSLRSRAGLREGLRRTRREAARFGAVWTAVVACLAVLVLPLAVGISGLTTVSLGSCDAADYAAGARVLQEFARSDRDGFIGLTEVVRVHSVDNFFDYWLRLNHFTPSALIALNGTVLDCAPHELTSLMTMVLLAGSLPVVFWVARAVLRLPRRSAVTVAVFYGLNPIPWYAVAHVAPAQLLAAQAIALITWAGVALWRSGAQGRSGWQSGAVLAIGYVLVLGSYNFILLVCAVPALAYAGGLALRRGEWGRFGRWSVAMLVPLIVSGGLFFERVSGLADRLTLLQTYDFGWRIPVLTPEGWVGFLRDAASLAGFASAVRWLIALGLVAAVVAALRRNPARAWAAACLTVPALAGYAYLQWRGAAIGTNASYDAYKLLAVFFPGILGVSLAWLPYAARAPGWWRAPAGVLAVLVGLAHFISLSQFYHALKSPPLQVTLPLRDVRRIEAMPEVTSLNMLVPDMWSRLWANAFLLRKPQFFPTHTYEGRRNTELRGEWDLQGDLVFVSLPGGAAKRVSPQFAVADRRHPAYVRAGFGEGWHPQEQVPAIGERWRWSQRRAAVRLENSHGYPIAAVLTLDVAGFGEREIEVRAPGRAEGGGVFSVGENRSRITLPAIEIPPGGSEILLHSKQPAAPPGTGDPRKLALQVFGIEVAVQRE